MKIAIVILGILGALSSGYLGLTWMEDINEVSEFDEVVIQLTGQADEIRGLTAAAMILFFGFFAGIAGAIAS